MWLFLGLEALLLPYLTGAPLLWAGFSKTVTVLSVWFSDVSWSYVGMDGAEGGSQDVSVLKRSLSYTRPHCGPPTKVCSKLLTANDS